MPLYDYLTPKLDFKRKFNHRQSFLYKGRLTVRTIRKFFESDHHYESNPELEVRFEIESNLEASQVPTFLLPLKIAPSHGGSGPPSNTWFLGPTRVLNTNSISIGAAVSQGSLV